MTDLTSVSTFGWFGDSNLKSVSTFGWYIDITGDTDIDTTFLYFLFCITRQQGFDFIR